MQNKSLLLLFFIAVVGFNPFFFFGKVNAHAKSKKDKGDPLKNKEVIAVPNIATYTNISAEL